MVWSPLAIGMLTGKYRRGQRQPDSMRAKRFPEQMSDGRRLDAVERLILLAQDAGLSLTNMAMAFAVAHLAVTSAIIGPRTVEHLEDVLAGAGGVLDGGLLDRIDEIVPPSADVGSLEAAYSPPAITQVELRRRPAAERAVA